MLRINKLGIIKIIESFSNQSPTGKLSMKYLFILSTTILFLILCQVAQSIIEPVIFSFFVITLTRPLQKSIEHKINKPIAIVITILLTFSIFIVFFSLIGWSGRVLIEWINLNFSKLQALFQTLKSWLELHDIFISAIIADQLSASSLINLLQAVIGRLNNTFAFTFLVLLYVIMGLSEADRFKAKLVSMHESSNANHILSVASKISIKFNQYMVVRTLVSILTGVIVYGLAKVSRLDLASELGILAFALNYLPIIGSIIATILPTLGAVIQFGASDTAIFIFITIATTQLIIGNYLEPLFSGSTLSISPFVVVFSTILWTYLWGPLGAFLGIPILTTILTFCAEFQSSRWISEFLSAD